MSMTMNIQISLKFLVVCTASKVFQNYNDLGLRVIHTLQSLDYCDYIFLGLHIYGISKWGGDKIWKEEIYRKQEI